MSLTVTWSPSCHADIHRMPYRVAERVCMAVIAFARDGSGTIERARPDGDDPFPLFRIRAQGGFALVRVELDEAALYVWGIYANAMSRRLIPLL